MTKEIGLVLLVFGLIAMKAVTGFGKDRGVEIGEV